MTAQAQPAAGLPPLDTLPMDAMPLDTMPLDTMPLDLDQAPAAGREERLDLSAWRPEGPAPAAAEQRPAPRPGPCREAKAPARAGLRPLKSFTEVEDGPSFYLSLSDLMSLLLVFFVLIFSLTAHMSTAAPTVPPKEAPAAPPMQARTTAPAPIDLASVNPFPHPEPMSHMMRLGLKGVMAGGQGDPGLSREPRPEPAPPAAAGAVFDPALLTLVSSSVKPPAKALPTAETSLSVLLAKVRREVKRAPAGVEVEQKPGRLVLRLPEAITFDPGKAQVLPGMAGTLRGLARALAQGRSGAIVVTGHTDDMPIDNQMYASNWELSAARAAAVARALMDQGIDPARITIQGMADQRPRVPNDSPEHRAQNRRVEIELRTKG